MSKKDYKNLIDDLNNDKVEVRLASLKKLKQMIDDGELGKPDKKEDRVNNHIHTTYSFSPYSPTRAIWEAYQSGLITAGIMDHDSIMGAREFIEAGEIIGIATTIGIECRVDFSETSMAGKRLNNPDQKSIAYMAIHGVPHSEIDTVQKFFAPYSQARNKRNRLMVDKLNKKLEPAGIQLDFEEDIIPVSEWDNGGSITERHLLFALSLNLIDKYGRGKGLLDFLKDNFELDITSEIEGYLMDSSNENYEYDLLGLLKKDMVSSFYVEATAECPDVREVLELADSVSAISAYAYLGDVEESVTGDKKAQKFEDDYLEELFVVLKNLGFNAVTYMPTRNTMAQLKRLKGLCEKYEFFQISGEDINSPRQSFICEALKDEEFHNLIDSTWALIGHEKSATRDLENGMFSEKSLKKYPELKERISVYKKIGRNK